MSATSATSANYGFSPRIYPRPKYPSVVEQGLRYHIFVGCIRLPFITLCCSTFRDIVWQSGIIGTALTYLVYPYYLRFVQYLKTVPIIQLYNLSSEAYLFALLLTLTHVAVYTIVNGSFGIFDSFGLFQQFKLMRKEYMIPKPSLILRTLAEAAFGTLIFGPIVLVYLYPSIKKFGLQNLEAPLPDNPLDIGCTYMFAHLFNGVGFYFAHRLFHSKLLYSTFHKQHHEYTGCSLDFPYCHAITSGRRCYWYLR